jgi:hypothetical protein
MHDGYFEHSIFEARPTILKKMSKLRIMSKVLIKTYNCQKKIYKIIMLYMEPS